MAIWDVHVELERLHHAEVRCALVGESRLVVEVESCGDDGVLLVDAAEVEPSVALFVALPSNGPDELDNGVIEIQGNPDLRVAGLEVECLMLNDENFVLCGCESISLGNIEIDICGLDARVEVVGLEAARRLAVLDDDVWPGDDDALLEAFPLDMQLHAVELEGG